MKQPNIVLVDYGVGNTYSICNAIDNLGYKKIQISDSEALLSKADVLILPGVGAFDSCIRNIYSRNLDKILTELVFNKKKPILGICVGMQLFATRSEENGVHAGLNWIPGNVIKLTLPDHIPVPHVGWNNVEFPSDALLFSSLSDDPDFYFDHSYHFACDESYVSAFCNYGIKVTAAVQHENIFGVQFHPEKSQNNGLKMFRSFFNSI